MIPSRDSMFSVLGCLCVLFMVLVAMIKIFHKLWWAPIRLQKLLNQRGIRGPPYRFIHGSTKEIMAMYKEAMSKPLGLSHNIFPKLQPDVHSWASLYGKNYVEWKGCEAQLVVTDADLAKEILIDRDGVFSKGKAQVLVQRLLGDGLVSSNGEKWVKVRKLANYAFHAESLKSMIPDMVETAEAMLERWKAQEGKEIEVHEEFRLFTSEVISRTAFGSSYLEGKRIFEMMTKLTMLASRNFYKLTFPVISKVFKTADEKESERLEKEVYNSIVEIIRKREASEEYGNDFLGLLVKAHHDPDERQRISVGDVVDECKTFYFAGQETTNSLLSWTVLLLAIHVDWQEKAREEVLNVLGKKNPTPDDLSKLKTMGMIFNESLRLYCPVVRIFREVTRVTRLGEFDLPADLGLLISSIAIHHDPDIWGPEAQIFKPERFSEGVAKATNNNSGAFLPFGMGPRTCVGFNFAISEAKVALAMILQRYSFTLSPAYIHSPVVVLTNRPQFGLQVILQPL